MNGEHSFTLLVLLAALSGIGFGYWRKSFWAGIAISAAWMTIFFIGMMMAALATGRFH